MLRAQRLTGEDDAYFHCAMVSEDWSQIRFVFPNKLSLLSVGNESHARRWQLLVHQTRHKHHADLALQTR